MSNLAIPVLVDTREQRPWSFDPDLFAVRPATLDAGDYSLIGLENRVAIERKSLGDFVSTVIHQWLRFRKELNKLGGFDVAIIGVEANVSDVVAKRYHGDAHPESVLARAAEITIDHGIAVCWWGDSLTAERMAARFLKLAWKRFA